jgi:flagellar protein FlgJ
MAVSIALPPARNADALLSLSSQPAAAARAKMNVPAKASAAAQDFEAVFLQSMFSQMFTGVDGDGPFGGSQGVGVWRSFLTQEYAKSFAQKGGIGIADHVYRSLMAQQEMRASR